DEKTVDTYRSLLLMTEISKEEPLSQRELARRLGIALGLVNSYLRHLTAKGYVRIRTFPRNRYGYLLTPQGIAEKSRLAYRHLSYFTNLYKITRQDYLALFRSLEAGGVKRVLFCGVDEVAEIAFLSLRETGLELASVIDDEHAGCDFFNMKVNSFDEGLKVGSCPVIITSLKKKEQLEAELLRKGIERKRIFFAGDDTGVSQYAREGL
ncbi:MAG TPA: winged helix-turn-helix transcriptional regulator, partial [Geobacteraceae bacterium]|nr:winged helix-turn-helix transcriptional regulator [Geobacteraceae bacterium]